MKRCTLKRTALASAIALSVSLSFVVSVSAESATDSSASVLTPIPKESLATKRKLFEERQQKVEHEAVEAITGTQNALMALQKRDTKKAMALLQDVSGKLDVLLTKYPDLTLIPANIEIDIYNFDGNPKQVEKMVNKAVKLLKTHKVQDARYLLAELVSEMRVTTTSIPLGTFPAAVKNAANLIDKAKVEAAEEALYDTLNTLVKTIELIPLPVLQAEELLTAASELEHKSDLTQERSRKEILKLTDEAKDRLKLAETLGYGDKDDYKPLYNAIDDLKDVIHSERSAAVWNNIKTSLSAFKNKIIHPKK